MTPKKTLSKRIGKFVWKNAAELSRVFFPTYCPVCAGVMGPGERVLCTRCRDEMPYTGFWMQRENPITEKFAGLILLETASAFIYFHPESNYRGMIHGFKYFGNRTICAQLGRWYGEKLHESGLYDSVDVLVPIPLHGLKFIQREYNQSELLAQGIAEGLGVGVDSQSVRRTVYTRSQARKHRTERWKNVAGIFHVKHPERLAGKHILIVDDVLTTGATIESCASAICKAVPDCRISIAAFAVSAQQLKKYR